MKLYQVQLRCQAGQQRNYTALLVVLRPLQRDDFASIVNWLHTPHVARWWMDPADLQSVVAKYEPRLAINSPTRVFIVEVDKKAIGLFQYYEHVDYPAWNRAIGIKNAAGIDYFIGEPSYIGKGLGSDAIREGSRLVFELYQDIDVVVSVPQKENLASCQALEKAGFQLIDERKLESDDPSDAGISCIYVLRRISGN